LNPYASRRRNLKPGEDDVAGTIPRDSASSESESARDEARSDSVLPRSAATWEADPVEAALAKALTDASGAGRFDVVIQIVNELEARRLAGLSRDLHVWRPDAGGYSCAVKVAENL
jgi:hypothetical protein